jgi:hypothetical protein
MTVREDKNSVLVMCVGRGGAGKVGNIYALLFKGTVCSEKNRRAYQWEGTLGDLEICPSWRSAVNCQ